VYSLAAPWLAGRAQASATAALGAQRYDAAAADLRRAHSYDPLATGILVDEAALASDRDAVRLYRDALTLEPSNAGLWFQFALFYAEGRHWGEAYQALARAYRFDPFGPAGQCGAAATIRRKAGVKGVTCRGGGSAPLP
jgi:tetratricopeptide (TPR) repeat protein